MDLARLVLRFNADGRRLEEHAVLMAEDEPSNCLLWALRQRALLGGHVVFVHSDFGPWEHAMWMSPTGELWEYDPIDTKYQRLDLPTLFAGVPTRIA